MEPQVWLDHYDWTFADDCYVDFADVKEGLHMIITHYQSISLQLCGNIVFFEVQLLFERVLCSSTKQLFAFYWGLRDT